MTEQFSTPSGARATVYPGDGPTIVVWPAMGIPAAKYQRLAVALQNEGLFVVTADYPGQPDSIDRSSNFGYAELSAAMGEVADLLRARRPDSTVYFIGHSLGGQLSAALESTRPGAFDGLVLAAAGTPHWLRFPLSGILTPLIYPTAFALKARLSGYFDGRKLGFGVQSAATMRDWSRMARTGSWGPHERSSRAFPLLAVSFADDTYAPESATVALCAEFPGAKVTRWYVSEPLGHVGWLREPGPLVEAVCSWLVRIGETVNAPMP